MCCYASLHLKKPVWSGRIIDGVTSSNLWASALVMILMSTLIQEIGR